MKCNTHECTECNDICMNAMPDTLPKVRESHSIASSREKERSSQNNHRGPNSECDCLTHYEIERFLF